MTQYKDTVMKQTNNPPTTNTTTNTGAKTEWVPERCSLAIAAGFAKVSVARFSAAAGVSESAIRDWLRGASVTPQVSQSIQTALLAAEEI